MQSSANSQTVELEIHSGRSFMYTRNRMGPSTVPCGTPEVTGTDVEVSPSSTTAWVLFLRKSAIQACVRGQLHTTEAYMGDACD